MAEKREIQSLKCSICHEAFTAPTLLTCGHTFCKACLVQYDKQHRGHDFMECPLCKRRTKLDQNRVAGLSPNFSLKGIEEELHIHLKANGKSSDYCSLHSQVYKDILCLVCKKFICLTCLFNDEHQGHRYKKKEEVEAVLEENRNSAIKKSEEKKAQIKKYITHTEQHMRDMHSHLEDLGREIENSFRKKSEILRGHRERLSKKMDDIRKNSDKVMTDFIERQEQSLQSIDVKSTLIGQDGIASTSTCKLPDSDALTTLYMGYLDLTKELDRDLDDPSIAHALQEVDNTRFRPSDENDLKLGTVEQHLPIKRRPLPGLPLHRPRGAPQLAYH